MRALRVLGVSTLILSSLPGVGAEDSQPLPQEDGVLVLNATTLDSELKRNGLLMVEFYAPWCGHCEQLAPEYSKAALELAGDGLVLGKVDCDANEELCDEDRWDIEGFPAIKVMRGSTIHDYEGARVAADIAAFMRKVAAFHDDSEDQGEEEDGEDDGDDDDEDDLDDVDFEVEDGVFVLGEDNLDALAKELVLIFVHFFTLDCKECDAITPALVEAAEDLLEFYIPVAKVDCEANKRLCREERWGVTSFPTLKVYRDGEIFTYYERPVTSRGVVEFMKELAGIDENYSEDDDDSKEADGDEGDEEDGEDEVGEVDESNVMVLDASNIEAALKEHELLMLEFFAGWCGNCKRLKPRYAKAADELAAEGIRLAKVDCEADEYLCADKRWMVEGFPTLYAYRRGRFHMYEGPPEQRDIVDFMRAVAVPTPKPLATVDDVEAFLGGKEVSVVGFFEAAEGQAYETFAGVADADVRLTYGVSTDEQARRVYGAAEADKVVVFKTFDEERSVLTIRKITSETRLKEFIENASRRLVLEMGTPDAYKAIQKKDGVVMFIFTEAPDESGNYSDEVTEQVLAAATELSRKNDKKVSAYVRVVNNNEPGEGMLAFMFGEDNKKSARLPAVSLVYPPKGEKGVAVKYLHEGEMTLEALEEFERKYFAGELTPHMRSEEPAMSDMGGPVRVVKGKTFQEVVVDNGDDILLECYAPWCPHCKTLEPTYREVAVRTAHRRKLVVAKMDATSNDVEHPGVIVNQYPTFYFFPGNAKDSPVQFSGTADLNSLLAFIDEHAHHASSRSGGGPSAEDPRYTEL